MFFIVGLSTQLQFNKLGKIQISRIFVLSRFLATGDSYFTIAAAYRISRASLSKIVPETCSAIWEELKDEYLPVPNEEKWRNIAHGFENTWNFPQCVGAIDGKHVVVQAPPKSGSMYYNYKKCYSVVLMAVVDAHYNFVVVDVGAYGKQSDGNVLANSTFRKKLLNMDLALPPPESIAGTSKPRLPFAFVGDEAFPLLPNLLRPYPGDYLPY